MNRAGLWRTGSSRSDLWFLLPLEEAFCCSAQWWCNRKQFHVVCNVKYQSRTEEFESLECQRKWIGSLSNHDDIGNENVTNLHIWQRKTIVLHALQEHFSFLDISQTFLFFPQCQMSCFVVVWIMWAYDDKCSMLSSYIDMKHWFQFNSRIMRT